MLLLLVLLLSALPSGHAVDSGGLVFCGETKPDIPICLQRISDACYDCLHPIETSCGNPTEDSSGYANCFCTVPGQSWKSIETCLNDPSTGCADSQKLILNVYGVECATSSRKDDFEQEVCGVQQTDPLIKALAEIHCEGNIPGGTVTGTGTTTRLLTTTSQASATRTSSIPATGTTLHKPPSNTSSKAQPAPTAGAPNLKMNGVTAVVVVVLGAAAIAM